MFLINMFYGIYDRVMVMMFIYLNRLARTSVVLSRLPRYRRAVILESLKKAVVMSGRRGSQQELDLNSLAAEPLRRSSGLNHRAGPVVLLLYWYSTEYSISECDMLIRCPDPSSLIAETPA